MLTKTNLQTRKGALILRDIVIIMVVAFLSLLLATLFIDSLADGYGNSQMQSEVSEIMYDSNSSFNSLYSNLTVASDKISPGESSSGDGGLSQLEDLDNLKLVPQVIGLFINAPMHLSNTMKNLLLEINIPITLATIIVYTVWIFVAIVLIFAIITIFLRGSKA